jgi:hypothetical protein
VDGIQLEATSDTAPPLARPDTARSVGAAQ